MQGFIIDFKPVRDDDLIVTVLTKEELLVTYRFYGARHSHINLGYKIDFELEYNLKNNIPRLKDVIHLNFSWIHNNEKLHFWQQFLKLFYNHLKDTIKLDPFYFNLLSELIIKMDKQDSKRAIIEAYTILLNYEGRLNTTYECLLCDKIIIDNVSLIRALLPTHPYCSYGSEVSIKKIDRLLNEKTTIDLNDEECLEIWNIILQGL